jgi:hypothetical protein
MTGDVTCRATPEIQDGGRIISIRITYGSEVLYASHVVWYLKQLAEAYNN